MDRATEELKHTIVQAQEYLKSENHHLEELLCHTTALKEDVDVVEKERSGDKNLDKDAEETIRAARRVKRDLDKLSFPLLRAKEAAKMQLRKDELEVERLALRVRQTRAEKETAPVTKVSAIKLPTIKLPIFSGEVEQWRGFKQIFLDLMEEDPDMSSTKKWLLLKESLAGKALEIVQELPASPETYKVAMDLLDQAFGSVNKAVTHLYQRLQNVPVASMGAENLRLTHAKLDGMLRSLELLGENVAENRFLRTVVISKFPRELFTLLRVTDEMSLPDFRKKITSYVASNENSLETLAPSRSYTAPTTSTNASSKQNRFRGRTQPDRPSSSSEAEKKDSSSADKIEGQPPTKKSLPRSMKCSFCGSSHYSDQCDVYCTLEQRQQKLGDRCLKCFRPAHPGKECARTIKCAHCDDLSHNRALCPKKLAPVERTCHLHDEECGTSEATKNEEIRAEVITEVMNAEYVTMMMEAYSSVTAPKGETARALLDTASRRTLIRRSLSTKLGVKENRDNAIRLYGVTNMAASKEPSPTCKIYLRPPGHRPIVIEAIIVDEIVEGIEAASVTEFRRRYPQFSQLPIPEEGNGKIIELLIGTRSLLPILTLQDSITVSPTIQLLSTKFGWVVFGGYDDADEKEETSIATLVIQASDPVKLMCDLDVVGLKGIENTKNEEEAIALNKFYETLKLLEDNRYEMGLPYRYDPPDLPDNFGLAWGRLQSLYKKLTASPDLLKAYDQQIKVQEENGVIEKVFEKAAPTQQIHYIAHQVVIRMDKSTPVRIVLDASAHTSGKRSLNDNILKGANWVDDMPALLMRFRKNAVAVTADVEKAFHQLSIRKQDRDVCRFLWLKDVSKSPSRENLQVYRFRRVAFGIASSPFLLYATMKHHLRKNQHEFTDILDSDFYADNLITSIPESTNLPDFYEKAKKTFSTMSMNLTKWTSNSKILHQLVPENDQCKEDQQLVLGLRWKRSTDKMGIQVKQNAFNSQKITKRRILKEAATIFDPLGWAMPIILAARIFIRQVWKQNYAWDEALPEPMIAEWQKLRQTLLSISSIELPRKMFTNPACDEEQNWHLHIFSDASIEAYAVVAFLQSNTEAAFIGSRARLSPKVQLSIPRLELLAAVIAARYSSYIQKSLKTKKKLRVTLWSDSKCILSWLKSNKILPAYVHKLVAEIRGHEIKEYMYVPSEKNPADVASRGADYFALRSINWWNAPQWLLDPKNWPKQEPVDERIAQNIALKINKEEKILLTRINLASKKINPKLITSPPFAIDPTKFSTMTALLRRSAWLLHGINRIFLRRIGRKAVLLENEKTNYEFVRSIWLKWDQKRAYAEIPIQKRSNMAYLRNIAIFKDENDLIRCSTRLQNSGKQADTISPILLVKDSPITTLLVMNLHYNNFHSGTAFTLAALRRRYWLPQGRQQIFKIIRANCTICQKHSAKPFALPEMAPLPEFRIQEKEIPFRNTGLDIFGPFKTRQPTEARTFQKRWVIIFTCMIIRAVHFEVIQDMTTSEILHAFRRFIARRGTPAILVSDNAPQFHVIDRKFVSIWHHLSENSQTVEYFAEKQIKWKFIPAHSPWMGGVYERLIKSVKDALEKTHPTVIMTDRQFSTVITEIEGVLNTRPISYVDKTIDTTIITPNHFLALRYPAIPLNFETNLPQDDVNQLWKAGEEYLNAFWKKWSENYVLALNERSTNMRNPHLSTKREPKPGEVVLMVDPTTRRSSWRKAVIERLIHSQDSKIRSAQIKLANGGRMIRPINKLLSLDLVTDLPDIQVMQLNDSHSGLVHQLPESVNGDDENNGQPAD